MIANLFDRFFIDEWWVGHTKAWLIPGTEDLRPYNPAKTKITKWVGKFYRNIMIYQLLNSCFAINPGVYLHLEIL